MHIFYYSCIICQGKQIGHWKTWSQSMYFCWIHEIVGTRIRELALTMRHSTSFTDNDIDWLTTTFTQAQKAQDGVCRNLVVGMLTQIVYADIGSLQQPQAKILGVLVTYQTDMVKFQVRQTSWSLASCLLIFFHRWAPGPEQTWCKNSAFLCRKSD